MTLVELIFYTLFCLTIAATVVLAAAKLEIKHRHRNNKKEKRK